MVFLQAVRTGFRNYANFKGYAPRSEFWLWILFFALTAVAAAILDSLTPTDPTAGSAQVGAFTIHLGAITWFQLVQRLTLLLPTLAFTARRARDAGYGWGHAFWLLVPVASTILLIVLAANGTAPKNLREKQFHLADL